MMKRRDKDKRGEVRQDENRVVCTIQREGAHVYIYRERLDEILLLSLFFFHCPPVARGSSLGDP